MTALAVFVIGVLRRKSLSLCLGLMALLAQLSAGLARLPRMVAFQTILHQCFRMLLMGKLYLPLRNIEGDFIFAAKAPVAVRTESYKTAMIPMLIKPFSFHFTFSFNKLDFKGYQIFTFCQEKMEKMSRKTWNLM
jgi:hypothetical protein